MADIKLEGGDGDGVALAKTGRPPSTGNRFPASDAEKQQHPSPLDSEDVGDSSSDEPPAITRSALQDVKPAEETPDQETETKGADVTAASGDESVYSVFSRSQRIFIGVIVSFTAVISPLTGSAYLPAMNEIAADLGVRTSLINLTITTYQIFQGLAPSVIASLADNRGRRPAYIIALSIYVVANLALALQDSYAALMVLRCLQSAGSSATIALAGAVASDLVTRAQRGSFIGWSMLGISLGPALGPVIGGLLAGYGGWRSIFWFLLGVGGVTLILMLTLVPETCRAVVGNASVRPQWWNVNLVQWLEARKPDENREVKEDRDTIAKPRKSANPLSALKILFEPEAGITLGFGSLLFAGYFMVMTTLSEQLARRFGFDSIKIGLCYLPLGVGALVSRFTAGQLFDWNFKRHARLLNIKLDRSRQQSIDIFPIERIRLEICIPMVYISCGTVLAYAWTMQSASSSLAGIEVALFFQGLFFSGALQGINTLIIDTNQDTPATASAASNLCRCLVSAAGTAIAPLMIERIGIGFMGVFISGVWLVFSPCLWLVIFKGKSWREKQKLRREKSDAKRAKNGDSKV